MELAISLIQKIRKKFPSSSRTYRLTVQLKYFPCPVALTPPIVARLPTTIEVCLFCCSHCILRLVGTMPSCWSFMHKYSKMMRTMRPFSNDRWLKQQSLYCNESWRARFLATQILLHALAFVQESDVQACAQHPGALLGTGSALLHTAAPMQAADAA